MDKLRTIEDIVQESYVPAWVGAASFVSTVLAVFGGIGVVAAALSLVIALAGSNSAYGQSQPGLTAIAATYLLGASLSVLAMGSVVANLAGCRKHLQQLVALRLHELRVEIPVSDGFVADAENVPPPADNEK